MAWPKGQKRKPIPVKQDIEVSSILEGCDFKKGNLKEIVDEMKTLLKTFQYDMNISLEENNGILSAIKLEIKIKPVR